MIKTLRQKFIVIMMSIVSILLITIFLTIITIMSSSLKEQNTAKLRQLLQTGVLQDYSQGTFKGGTDSRVHALIVELKADGSYYIAANQFFSLRKADCIVKAAALQERQRRIKGIQPEILKIPDKHDSQNSLCRHLCGSGHN